MTTTRSSPVTRLTRVHAATVAEFAATDRGAELPASPSPAVGRSARGSSIVAAGRSAPGHPAGDDGDDDQRDDEPGERPAPHGEQRFRADRVVLDVRLHGDLRSRSGDRGELLRVELAPQRRLAL